MSNALSEMDRELLGEVSHTNGGEATMAKANDGPGNGAFEGSYGATFTPLNATAGTLIKVSNNGDELESGSVSYSVVAHLTPTLPPIFYFLRSLPVSKHQYFVPHMISPKVFPLPHCLQSFSSCNFATNFFTPKSGNSLYSQPHALADLPFSQAFIPIFPSMSLDLHVPLLIK